MTGWSPTVDEIAGRFTHASNATLLGSADGKQVIYKPTAGARPLWDFDAGTLAAREVLTYRVSEALGLDVVPETVIGDGPYGPGSVQRFVEVDRSFDPLPLLGGPSTELWPIALLDIVVNNADRKAGHILKHRDGRLQAIDHGLTFHPEPKLRTVLWGFCRPHGAGPFDRPHGSPGTGIRRCPRRGGGRIHRQRRGRGAHRSSPRSGRIGGPSYAA